MQKYANLVELEKCCQTHIFLQNFVLIQPRASPPKICKILQTLAPEGAPEGDARAPEAAGPHAHGALDPHAERPPVPRAPALPRGVVANFGKFSLVFGCIGADLCK